MKTTLAFLIALSACGDDVAYSPDAAQLPPVIDSAAKIDAPPTALPECPMGNLPTSRTLTINTGDPIPPGLINELQDVAIGNKRNTFIRRFLPTFHFQTDGSTAIDFWKGAVNPTGGAMPCFKAASATLVTAWFFIPFEEGETFTGFSTEIYGDGAIDPAINIDYAIGSGSVLSGLGVASLTNVPAAWTAFPVGITPQVLAAGSVLVGNITTTSISTANVYVGAMSAQFKRP